MRCKNSQTNRMKYNEVLLIFVLILCSLLFYYLLKWYCKVVYNADWLFLIKQTVTENCNWCVFFSCHICSTWGVISSPKGCIALVSLVVFLISFGEFSLVSANLAAGFFAHLERRGKSNSSYSVFSFACSLYYSKAAIGCPLYLQLVGSLAGREVKGVGEMKVGTKNPVIKSTWG